MADLKAHRALVTGASSGIGAAMARVLASWGCDLTLSARRQDRLEALAAELRSAHGVQVRCVSCDLSKPGGPRALYEQVVRAGERIDILVNNAGCGVFQRFADASWPSQANMIQLNVLAVAELTHCFLADMRGRDRRAYILHVASVAAYQPVPYFACYGGSKAFVRDFSEALAYELADTNVTVSCVSPGATRTEFKAVSGQILGRIGMATMMDADRVARDGLRAMLRRRRNIVPGWLNAIAFVLVRFLPRRAATWAAAFVQGKPEPRLPEPKTS